MKRSHPFCGVCGAFPCFEHEYPCAVCGLGDRTYGTDAGIFCGRHLPEEEKFVSRRGEELAREERARELVT